MAGTDPERSFERHQNGQDTWLGEEDASEDRGPARGRGKCPLENAIT